MSQYPRIPIRALPLALKRQGFDIHRVLPAYREVLAHAGALVPVTELMLPGMGEAVRVLRGTLSSSDVLPYYLIDAPRWFDRLGGPYTAPRARYIDQKATGDDRRYGLHAEAVESPTLYDIARAPAVVEAVTVLDVADGIELGPYLKGSRLNLRDPVIWGSPSPCPRHRDGADS